MKEVYRHFVNKSSSNMGFSSKLKLCSQSPCRVEGICCYAVSLMEISSSSSALGLLKSMECNGSSIGLVVPQVYCRFKPAPRVQGSPISPLSPQDSIISSTNASPAAAATATASNYYYEQEQQQQVQNGGLTLQELENALLGPDDDDEQQQQHQVMQLESMSRSPEGLLLLCAEAIANNDLPLASEVLARLRQLVSIFGDPMQRLAAYMMEGLVARVQCSGRGLYLALKCSEPPSPSPSSAASSASSPAEVLSAMQIMYEVCPYFKFGYMAANGAIAEAFKDEARVHIVDFEINQGTQWVTLIQALAARPGGPPRVRITAISSNSSKALDTVGKRLERVAASVGVPLIFQPLVVARQAAEVEEWMMLERDHGEALAVNFALQLHHVPDESVCPSNPRDSVLRMVKALRPKVVTLVEQEANTNTAPFLARFAEALHYYAAVFDSLDATLPRDSRERVSVEQLCLARDIVNIVACEGAERVERHEVMGKWRARMAMAGFRPCPLSCFVNATIKQLLESYCSKYRLHEEAGCLYLGWLNRVLIVASAWC